MKRSDFYAQNRHVVFSFQCASHLFQRDKRMRSSVTYKRHGNFRPLFVRRREHRDRTQYRVFRMTGIYRSADKKSVERARFRREIFVSGRREQQSIVFCQIDDVGRTSLRFDAFSDHPCGGERMSRRTEYDYDGFHTISSVVSKSGMVSFTNSAKRTIAENSFFESELKYAVIFLLKPS